jgi:1,2-diacylglycerol 3-beta-galactosyltransferase
MTAPTRQRRVLFLIADTGAGHRSAANAIHHAMRLLAESPSHAAPRTPVRSGKGLAERPGRLSPNDRWEALIVDAFVECSRFPLRNGVFLYAPAIRHSPRLYGQFFRLTNTSARFHAAARLARPFLYQGLEQLFLTAQPDLIVSVHPLLNHISLQVLRDLDARVPFLTVVTDLVSVHCSWIAPGVTACVVPTEAARSVALDAGVPDRRVRLLGMPIDPKFARPAAASREALRTELGLDPAKPTALLVGGGEGALGLAGAVIALARSDLDIQMLVVTGRNKQLFAHLQRARADFLVPAHILGFVQNMPDLMHAADVIVTKAGPGTIMEAMACGLPIVLTGAIPGQEEGNVEFVVEHDVGVLARSPGAVVDALREILAPGSPRLEELRANARALSRPEAAFDIARLILKHLPDSAAASPWQRVRRGTRRYRRAGRPIRPLTLIPQRSGPGGRAMGRVGRGSGRNGGRVLLSGLRQTADGRPRRLPGLANLRGARALLLRGTHLGKVQLRRPGGRRGRDDAGPAIRGGGD